MKTSEFIYFTILIHMAPHLSFFYSFIWTLLLAPVLLYYTWKGD